MPAIRIGHGYDAHRLAPGRRLVLGGVDIPHPRGLDGHSDADVVVHAVMDALLGAAALGDIGRHFPPGDPAYKDADSLVLLATVTELLAGQGWRPANIDATVIAQEPRLAGYIPQMRARVAAAAGLSADAVSIKATTEEQMGFTGRVEGIAAHAVALIQQFIPYCN